MDPGADVTVYDVGPGDGLQKEPEVLAPEIRAELVRRLVATGVPAVEVRLGRDRPRLRANFTPNL